MAEKDNTAKVAVGLSVGAAIAAAWALSRKTASAAVNDVIKLPAELWDLIIAMASSLVNIDEGIKALSLGGAAGWPPNANSITSLRVAIALTGTRLPYIAIPSGMSLVIMAWPLNPGWLQVGESLAACSSVNQSFPLLPNAIVGYQVENADQIWVGATAAGCFACLTVEQKKGGGG